MAFASPGGFLTWSNGGIRDFAQSPDISFVQGAFCPFAGYVRASEVMNVFIQLGLVPPAEPAAKPIDVDINLAFQS